MSAQKSLVRKANKAMYEVLKTRRLHNLLVNSQYDLFVDIVKPILYGSEIWGLSNTDMIERVQVTFCLLLLNTKKSTPSFMIYSKLGIYPMSLYTGAYGLFVVKQIVNGDDNRNIIQILFNKSLCQIS